MTRQDNDAVSANLNPRPSDSLARFVFNRAGASAVVLLTMVTGCASAGSFVWVDDAPASFFHPVPSLTIATGDLISVKVFGQEPLSVRVQVRSDGMIAMPLIGDVAVAGKGPGVVAKEVEARLHPFVTTPNVVVTIEESRTRVVAIGEIHHPGTLVLEAGETGLLPALANAGGITEFASGSGVYVLRSDSGGSYRIRFQYDDIIRGTGRAAAFRLHSGDQIVIE